MAETVAELARILESVKGIRGGRAAVLRAAAREAKALQLGLKSYRAHHWGLQGKPSARALRVADVSKPCTDMGELFAVEYLTEKGDDGPSLYRHEFESKLPILAFDAAGLLLIAGGSYTVEKRGIVG